MIVKVPLMDKYLVKNKGLYVGQGTESEHLWNAGYTFSLKQVLGIKFVIARK